MPRIEDDQFDQQAEFLRAHYSVITLHRRCAQAWYYRYELGLKRPHTGGIAPELVYGIWWGLMAGADALERGRKLDSLRTKPRHHLKSVDGGPTFDQSTMTVQEVLLASKKWWDGLPTLDQEECVKKMGETLPRRMRNAYLRWKDEYAEEQKFEQPIGTEIYWERTLPRPTEASDWEISDDPFRVEGLPTIKLLGFIDEAYFDTRRGMLVVRDNKFTSRVNANSALDDMMDSQLQLYAWGVEPLLNDLGAPRVRLVGYDRVLSTEPAKPRITQSGGLSAASKNWDLKTYLDWAKTDTRTEDALALRNAILERPQESWTEQERGFVERLGQPGQYYPGRTKSGLDAGIYQIEQSTIDRISTPVHRSMFNNRALKPINRNIIQSHLRAAVDTAVDIRRTQIRSQQTNEAARSLTSACKRCDYVGLCQAQMVGGTEGEFELAQFGLVGPEGRRLMDIDPDRKVTFLDKTALSASSLAVDESILDIDLSGEVA